MKNGYDQFFKKAQQVALQPEAAKKPLARKARPTRQRRKVFPVKLILLSGFGFSLALSGFIYEEKIELFLKRFHVNFMGQAFAEEAAKPAAPAAAPAKDAKAEGEKPAAEAKTEKEASSDSGPDLDHLQKLVDRQKDLEAKEEELKKVEEELAVQKQELEKKLKELEDVRGQISTVLNDRVQADSQKVDSLVQLYTNMRPQQSAKVFETLDEDLTVEVLGRMKKKNAAEIMNLMKPDKAKVLSEKLAGYKRTTASVPTLDKEPAKSSASAEPAEDAGETAAPEKAPAETKTKPATP